MKLPPLPDTWLIWLNTQQDPHTTPGFWLLASFVLYALGSCLGWWIERSAQQSQSLRGRIAALNLLQQMLRALYHLGPPYAAVLVGVIAARNLGIVITSWPEGLTVAAPMGVVGLGAVVIAGWTLHQQVSALPGGAPIYKLDLWVSLREAVFAEAHWGFYRAIALTWIPDRYLAIWVGVLLVFGEAAFNPGLWRDLKQPGRAYLPLALAVFCVVSAVLFYFSGSIWVSLLFHLLAQPLWLRLAANE